MTYNTLDDWPNAPHQLFDEWMKDAEKTEPHDPNAMCLATVGDNNMPSARMMLLKGHDERGFVFYTNGESKKGTQLAENMAAALCFHWKSLQKQVRIEGHVELVSQEDADAYFNSRPRNSRIGAWASKQSRPLAHRDNFQSRFEHYEEEFEGLDIFPRPAYWRGYRVIPQSMEFWINEDFRLHRRCVYTPQEDGSWQKTMMFP